MLGVSTIQKFLLTLVLETTKMETQSMLENLLILTSGLLMVVLERNSVFKESNLKNLLPRTQLVNVLLVNLNVDANVSP
jgi:hypothetical protein